MSRLDRILLCLAYVLLVALAVFGVARGQQVVEETVERTCEIQQVQLASLAILLQNVQLSSDTERDVLIAQVQDLRDAVNDDC